MPKTAYIQYDNLSDRKEAFYLLTKLHPARRLAWLAWCCRHASVPDSPHRPRIRADMRQRAERAIQDSSADEKLTVECLLDMFNLVLQYQLSIEAALNKLVEMVRKAH